MPASGAGPPRSAGRSQIDPERIAHGPGAIDDPSARRRADRPRRRPRPVPDEQRPGRDRRRRSPTIRSPASIAPASPVTLSTDDLTVSDVTLSEEYARAVAENGLTLPELWAIDRRALDVAFAEEAVLAPLRAEFDRWAAARRSRRHSTGRRSARRRRGGVRLARREPLQDRGQLRRVVGDRRRVARPGGSAASVRPRVVTPVSTGRSARRPPAPRPGRSRSRRRSSPRRAARAPTTRAASREEERLGLADRDRDDAGGHLDGRDHRAGAGHQTAAPSGRPGRGSSPRTGRRPGPRPRPPPAGRR